MGKIIFVIRRVLKIARYAISPPQKITLRNTVIHSGKLTQNMFIGIRAIVSAARKKIADKLTIFAVL